MALNGSDRYSMERGRNPPHRPSLGLPFSGCLYTFQAGAGFPDYVKTVAIVPFELGPKSPGPNSPTKSSLNC